MYVHSFSYLVNKLELGGYTYLQLKKILLLCYYYVVFILTLITVLLSKSTELVGY